MARRTAKPEDFLVAESPAMRAVVATVCEYAEHDAPVLIQGERGSGRELIARVLHFASARRGAGFVSVHAEMAPQVLAYDRARCTDKHTLRSAQGGTLLIKELADMPVSSQQRLSRVLDRRGAAPAGRDDSTGEVYDVRVVGSSETDIGAAVDAAAFDRDLFEALSAHRIDVPPLRERTADIAPLASQCIRQYARELGRGRVGVSTRALERLIAYPWPGNVAQLKSVARGLVLRVQGGRVDAADVEAALPHVTERVPLEDMSLEEMIRSKLSMFMRKLDGYPVENLYDEVVARVERPLFELVLEHTGGNQVRAAEILGLNRNTLRRKLGERGIQAKSVVRKPARRSSSTGSSKKKSRSTRQVG